MEKPPGFVDHFVHFPREIYGYPTGYVSLLEGKLRSFSSPTSALSGLKSHRSAVLKK